MLGDLAAHCAPIKEPIDADPHAQMHTGVEEREEAEHAPVLCQCADAE